LYGISDNALNYRIWMHFPRSPARSFRAAAPPRACVDFIKNS
jgi:hypothetical protein